MLGGGPHDSVDEPRSRFLASLRDRYGGGRSQPRQTAARRAPTAPSMAAASRPGSVEPPAGAASGDDDGGSSWMRIGRLGAWYVLRQPKWVRRHVETVTIKNLRSARRQLTVDLALPDDGAAIAERRGEHNLYFVPAFRLVKTLGRSYMDLENEHGRCLPLFTRRENAMISRAAVQESAHRLNGGPPGRRLSLALRELVYRPGLEGQLFFSLAKDLIARHHPDMMGQPGFDSFMDFLRDLSVNSVIWLPLEGRPAERRIVKLRYDTGAGPSDLRPRKERTLYVRVEFDGETSDHELEEAGDFDFRSAPGRIAARIGNALGMTAMGIVLRAPNVQGSESYHLQVAAPSGVEIRRITLLAKLRDSDPDPSVETDRDSAHLYLHGARVTNIAPALLEFRVGRRGFLSLSTLSAVVISGILWAYDAAAPFSEIGTRPEVATAVLLVAPLLLLAFVMKPEGEHPYAARLLVGVRICMLVLGMLAVADAAAIAGVRPDSWSLHHCWFVYALCSVAPAGVLVLGWVLSLETTEVVWARLTGVWESRTARLVRVRDSLVGAQRDRGRDLSRCSDLAQEPHCRGRSRLCATGWPGRDVAAGSGYARRDRARDGRLPGGGGRSCHAALAGSRRRDVAPGLVRSSGGDGGHYRVVGGVGGRALSTGPGVGVSSVRSSCRRVRPIDLRQLRWRPGRRMDGKRSVW